MVVSPQTSLAEAEELLSSERLLSVASDALLKTWKQQDADGKFLHDCVFDISEVISNSVSLFSTVSSIYISKYYRLLYLHVPPMISLLPIAVAST